MLAAEGLLKSMSSGITVLPNSLHFKLGPPGILLCLGFLYGSPGKLHEAGNCANDTHSEAPLLVDV